MLVYPNREPDSASDISISKVFLFNGYDSRMNSPLLSVARVLGSWQMFTKKKWAMKNKYVKPNKCNENTEKITHILTNRNFSKIQKFANPLQPIMYSVGILFIAFCDWSINSYWIFILAVLRKAKMAPSKGEFHEEQLFCGTFREYFSTKKTC